jgi:hypothetical protein
MLFTTTKTLFIFLTLSNVNYFSFLKQTTISSQLIAD